MTDRAKGIVSIVASALGFALMALFVRLCDDHGAAVSSFQKSFYRNLVALVIAGAVFIRNRHAHERLAVTPALVLRGVLGTCGIFANFYALSHITIAEGQTLNKTAPFFTVLFAWLFMKERASARQLTALGTAFLGVVLIAKPGFAGAAAFPLSMGLLGGVCAGAAYACLRTLRRQRVDPAFIVLFFSVFSCLASLPFVILDPVRPNGIQLVILFAAGASAALGQFGITAAYGFAAPREIAVYDYSNILFTALLGFAFFGQIPDICSLIGFAVIIFAAFRVHVREEKQ